MQAAMPSSGFEGALLRVWSFRPGLPQLTGIDMRWLIPVLILCLAALQYRLWVGEGSLADLHGLKMEIAHQEAEVARLRARNQELQAEVLDLGSGVEAIEERARSELGMLKPGEIFIQVIERRKPEVAP